MKASESIPNYKPKLREYANFAARTIKKVCSEIGPRECGTEAELKAQKYMAAQVGNAADEIVTEEFRVHPRAFLGWMKIDAVMLFVVLGLFVAYTFTKLTALMIASVVIIAVAVSIIAGEFLFYKEYVDFLFKEKTSHNTFCIRKASGETKRRIILGGHSDSSLEWRFTHLGGAPMMYVSLIYPTVGLLYCLFVCILSFIQGDAMSPVFCWVALAFLPGFIMLFMFMNNKICVDGANDNLTGCMCSAGVMKYLGDNNIRFENTEVVVMFSGGEEAGLRGAKAAAKAHGNEYKAIETMFVGLDTFKDYEDMYIYSKDMTNITKHDPRCCQLMKTASEYAGMDLKFSGIFCGASDAAAMTQAGIPSVALAAMNPGPPKYYHTRDDKATIIDLKTIEKGIEIALEATFLFDEKGLCEKY